MSENFGELEGKKTPSTNSSKKDYWRDYNNSKKTSGTISPKSDTIACEKYWYHHIKGTFAGRILLHQSNVTDAKKIQTDYWHDCNECKVYVLIFLYFFLLASYRTLQSMTHSIFN